MIGLIIKIVDEMLNEELEAYPRYRILELKQKLEKAVIKEKDFAKKYYTVLDMKEIARRIKLRDSKLYEVYCELTRSSKPSPLTDSGGKGKWVLLWLP